MAQITHSLYIYFYNYFKKILLTDHKEVNSLLNTPNPFDRRGNIFPYKLLDKINTDRGKFERQGSGEFIHQGH